jgi:hypothetical protein
VQRTGNINGEFRVVNIDSDNRTIDVEAMPGEGTIALSDNDHLILQDTLDFSGASLSAQSLASEGVESLLISSGNFPGTSLNVSNHSVLKSFIVDTTTSPEDPTPDAVALLVDKIADSGKQPPSVLFGERSLWTLYSQLEKEAGAMYTVGQGGAFTASGGVEGPVVTHMGHRFQKMVSVRMREGTLVGLSPDTWRKFIPLGNKTIHWYATNGPLSGANSIFLPVSSGTQNTELSGADYDSFIQFGCTDPRRNFRRLGFNTARTV